MCHLLRQLLENIDRSGKGICRIITENIRQIARSCFRWQEEAAQLVTAFRKNNRECLAPLFSQGGILIVSSGLIDDKSTIYAKTLIQADGDIITYVIPSISDDHWAVHKTAIQGKMELIGNVARLSRLLFQATLVIPSIVLIVNLIRDPELWRWNWYQWVIPAGLFLIGLLLKFLLGYLVRRQIRKSLGK
jgi:hypothetical protein